MVLLVVYWLFILWEFLAVAKVQQKNETNKKISNKMVTNYKVPIIKIHSFTDSPLLRSVDYSRAILTHNFVFLFSR